jgi:hypothetical protein
MRYLIIFLLLTACGGTIQRPDAPDTCGAPLYADLIGQDTRALERVLILRMVRVIRPTDAVTMDFRQERINFIVNDDEVIVDIRCG